MALRLCAKMLYKNDQNELIDVQQHLDHHHPNKKELDEQGLIHSYQS
jgi:hypothetical protein